MASINQRVRVKDLLGTVRYIGETQFAPGVWIGVQLDLKQGKNDGSVAGVRYFSCEMGYGVFARKSLVSSAEDLTDLQSSVHSDVDLLRKAILDSQKQIQALENRIEMKSVDLEHYKNLSEDLSLQLATLTAKNEELRLELQLLNEEAEINRQIEQEVSEQVEAYGVSGTLSVDEIKLLLEHNKKLQVALLQLQDLFDETKMANDTLKKDLDNSKLQNTELQETKVKLARAEQIIVELKEQLEYNGGLDVLVDQLTIENEELKAKVNSLTLSVQEMSEITELDRSLEEGQKAIEAHLRKEILKLMKVIEDDQNQIQLLKVKEASAQDAVIQLQAGMLPKYSRQIEDLTVQVKTERIKSNQLKMDNQVCLEELRVINEHLALSNGMTYYEKELSLILDLKIMASKIIFLKEHTSKINTLVLEASLMIVQAFIVLLETQFAHLVVSLWRDRVLKFIMKIDAHVTDTIAETPIVMSVPEILGDFLNEIYLHSSNELFLEVFVGLARLILPKEHTSKLPTAEQARHIKLHNRASVWAAFKDIDFKCVDTAKFDSTDWSWSKLEEIPIKDIYSVPKDSGLNSKDAKEISLLEAPNCLQQSGSVQELRDTIDILENSLSLAKTHHQKVVDQLQRSLANLKDTIQQDKLKHDMLKREIEALEYQVSLLVEAQRESQSRSQHGLGDIIQEKEHVERMTLLSEIQQLRRLVSKSTVRQDLAWLEPLEQEQLPVLPWSTLIPAGRSLRSSVQRAPYVTILTTEAWRPRISMPRYVVARLRQEKEIYRLCLDIEY